MPELFPNLSGESRAQLDQVVDLVRNVLGSDALGVYLYGSAVFGGLRPHSDLDVFAVSRRPTTREEKQRLVARLLEISRVRPPLRPIELTIAVQSVIRPWRYPPSFDFQYGEWMRREFESGNVEPWPTATNPDLALLITTVLRGNTPLLGPPPAEILDPVPHGDCVRASVGEIGELLGNLEADKRNVVLTLARIWITVATGEIRPKEEAADWALARLPEARRAVLARARAICVGDEAERWDDLEHELRQQAEYLVAEIERLV